MIVRGMVISKERREWDVQNLIRMSRTLLSFSGGSPKKRSKESKFRKRMFGIRVGSHFEKICRKQLSWGLSFITESELGEF